MPKNKKNPNVEQLSSGLSKDIKKRNNHYGKTKGKLISGGDLLSFLGLEEADLKKWRDEGCPHLPDPRHKGKFLYNSGTVLKWRYQTDIDEITETVLEIEPHLNNAVESREAERRYKVARALREELELAKEQQLVANIDDLMVNFASAAGHVRATLMSWNSRLPGLLAHKDEKTISDSLEKEIEDVLLPMSEYSPEYKENDL